MLCIAVLGGVEESSGVEEPCKIPLFVQEGAAMKPNVLIVFDNSFSMRRILEHDEYDRSTKWEGRYSQAAIIGGCYTHPGDPSCNDVVEDGDIGFVRGVDYFVWSSDYISIEVDADSILTVYLYRGQYPGNYLNWIFWHASDEARNFLPQQTRLDAAQEVLSAVIDSTKESVYYGLIKFYHATESMWQNCDQYDQGGFVLCPFNATDSMWADSVKAAINGLYIWAEGDCDTCMALGTPLAESTLEAWQYFSGGESYYDRGRLSYTSPILDWCQRNFMVVMTDGQSAQDDDLDHLQDWDGDGDDTLFTEYCGSDFLDDVTYMMCNSDARSDLDGKQNVVTYTIGFLTGQANPHADTLLMEAAENGNGIAFFADSPEELSEALQNIVRDIIRRTAAGGAVTVLTTETEGKDLIFRGMFHPAGWRGYLEAYTLPYDSGDVHFWEAGDSLESRDPGDRFIFTHVNGDTLHFDTYNDETLGVYMGFPEDTARVLIRWLRGNFVPTLRSRDHDKDGLEWKLGDIIYSTSSVIGPPKSFYMDSTYMAWRDSLLSNPRDPTIYVGANDGMLHAFRARNGFEKWAFIPHNLLPKLYRLTEKNYCHLYYVDLTPTAADVYFGGKWRTILIGGEREGGGGYFCLDVTDPDEPEVLWEYVNCLGGSEKEARESRSIPTVGRVTLSGGDKWLAFIGSSYRDMKSCLGTIDVETGERFYSFSVSSDSMGRMSSPIAIDMDLDDDIDRVYTGDMRGRLWKFNVSAEDTGSWYYYPVFDGESGGGVLRPITTRPTLTYDQGFVRVLFGTGKYEKAEDILNTDIMSFYCVFDYGGGETITRSELIDQTDSIYTVDEGAKGWYFDLINDPGERVTDLATVYGGIVYFTSYVPDTGICGHGGRSYLYMVDYSTGADTSGGTGARSKLLGEGIASHPVLDVQHEEVIVQTSASKDYIPTEGMANPPPRVLIRSWREVVDEGE